MVSKFIASLKFINFILNLARDHFYLNLDRCIAEELDGEGEILKTFTVDATVEGVSKEGATTGKINYYVINIIKFLLKMYIFTN